MYPSRSTPNTSLSPNIRSKTEQISLPRTMQQPQIRHPGRST